MTKNKFINNSMLPHNFKNSIKKTSPPLYPNRIFLLQKILSTQFGYFASSTRQFYSINKLIERAIGITHTQVAILFERNLEDVFFTFITTKINNSLTIL